MAASSSLTGGSGVPPLHQKQQSFHLIRISRMGNAGRNGGEYYTPRPLIRSMIDVLEPKIGETSPLNEDDLADFRKLFKKKTDSANSWTVNIADLDPETLDLTVRNPNAKEMWQAILREAFEGRL